MPAHTNTHRKKKHSRARTFTRVRSRSLGAGGLTLAYYLFFCVRVHARERSQAAAAAAAALVRCKQPMQSVLKCIKWVYTYTMRVRTECAVYICAHCIAYTFVRLRVRVLPWLRWSLHATDWFYRHTHTRTRARAHSYTSHQAQTSAASFSSSSLWRVVVNIIHQPANQPTDQPATSQSSERWRTRSFCVRVFVCACCLTHV